MREKKILVGSWKSVKYLECYYKHYGMCYSLVCQIKFIVGSVDQKNNTETKYLSCRIILMSNHKLLRRKAHTTHNEVTSKVTRFFPIQRPRTLFEFRMVFLPVIDSVFQYEFYIFLLFLHFLSLNYSD